MWFTVGYVLGNVTVPATGLYLEDYVTSFVFTQSGRCGAPVGRRAPTRATRARRGDGLDDGDEPEGRVGQQVDRRQHRDARADAGADAGADRRADADADRRADASADAGTVTLPNT